MKDTVHLLAALHLPNLPRGWESIINVSKSPANPLLREGLSPWDLAWLNTYPTVVFDASVGHFKLFYNGHGSCGTHEVACPSPSYPTKIAPATDRPIDATF